MSDAIREEQELEDGLSPAKTHEYSPENVKTAIEEEILSSNEHV
jgi:hypothetical protein